MGLWNHSTNSMGKESILPQNSGASPLECGQGRATSGDNAAGEQENFGIAGLRRELGMESTHSSLGKSSWLPVKIQRSPRCTVVTRTDRGTWSRIWFKAIKTLVGLAQTLGREQQSHTLLGQAGNPRSWVTQGKDQ